MKKTTNLGLSLYEKEDKLSITANENSLNHNMELIDEAIAGISVPTKTSDLINDSNYLTGIPSEYITETELNSKGYLTEHQDLSDYAKADDIPSKVSDLQNDSGFLTSYTETDPTVPSWAKAASKPSYTKSEVGLGNVDNVKQYSASNPPPYPVTSVNSKTGAVTLKASDVGADASGTASSVMSNHNSNNSAHEDIRQQISQLSSEIANKTAISFVNSKDEFTDTSKLYVLPDGSVYQHKLKYIYPYTNVISTSVDIDGQTIYNGVGYKENTRLSASTGQFVESEGITSTGYIRITQGAPFTVYMRNISGNVWVNLLSGVGVKIDASFGSETAADWGYSPVFDDAGNMIQFTAPSNHAYMVVYAEGLDSTSIITINEEITDEDPIEILDWFETGYYFVSDEHFSRIDDVENTAETHTEEIAQIKEYIAQEESNKAASEIPSYWHSALNEGVEAINTAICTAGFNKSAFLFYSDAHWDYGSQMSPKLLKYLYEHTGMTKTFFGGDIVNNESTDYDTMKYLWEWRNMLKGVPNHHSAVGNHDDGSATNDLFSYQYVYGYLLAAEETPDVVRGKDGMYYYVDSAPEKTRYIFFDTAYQGATANQIAFLKQALIDTPDGWHIIAIAHIWYNPDYNQYDIRPIPIAGMHTDSELICSVLDDYNARSGEFSSCGAKVEFCIGGHVHRDYVGATNGGIPIIIVETDSQHIRGEYTYIAGTNTESSVNGIVADYDQQIVHIIRVGRGKSFNVDLVTGDIEDPVAPTYTNVLSTSTDLDGNIYNSIGYKANTKYSTSQNAEQDYSGLYISGYIPVEWGDVIRMKNISLMDAGGNGVLYFETKGEWKFTRAHGEASNPAYGDGNELIEFTSDIDGFIRIQCNKIDSSSIITVNEPINDDPINTNYTNLISTAVDTDGVTLYNGKGWKENTRMSGTSGGFRDSDTSCCTGYITLPTGMLTIRLKNIAHGTANYGGQFYFFNGTGVAITDSVSYEYLIDAESSYVQKYQPVFDGDNIVQITVDNTDGKYTHMVHSAITIDSASIITINEPIE